MGRSSEKSVLITGTAAGTGLCTTLSFAERGADLVPTGIGHHGELTETSLETRNPLLDVNLSLAA